MMYRSIMIALLSSSLLACSDTPTPSPGERAAARDNARLQQLAARGASNVTPGPTTEERFRIATTPTKTLDTEQYGGPIEGQLVSVTVTDADVSIESGGKHERFIYPKLTRCEMGPMNMNLWLAIHTTSDFTEGAAGILLHPRGDARQHPNFVQDVTRTCQTLTAARSAWLAKYPEFSSGAP